MNNSSEPDIAEKTVQAAERLESIERESEIAEIEIEYTVARGSVTGVELLLTFGGPTIRVNALHGTVQGSWGGESHTTHFDSAVVTQYANRLAEEFEDRNLS